MNKFLALMLFLFTVFNSHAQSLYCGRIAWQSSNGEIMAFKGIGFTLHSLNSTMHVKTRPKGKIYLENVALTDHQGGVYTTSFINHVGQSTTEYDYWESTSTIPVQSIRESDWRYRRISTEEVDPAFLLINNPDYTISVEGVPENSSLSMIHESIGGADKLTRFYTTAEIEDVIDVSNILAGESRELSLGTFNRSGKVIINMGQYLTSGVALTDNPGVTIRFLNYSNVVSNNLTYYHGGYVPGGFNYHTPIDTTPMPFEIRIETTIDAIGTFTKTLDVTVNCD